MKKYLLVLVFGFLMLPHAFSQAQSDSLKTLLKTAAPDEKVDIYDQIIKGLMQSNPSEAMRYSKALINYADSISDLNGKATGLKWLGLNYENAGSFDEALLVWKEKIEIDRKLNNHKNIAYTTMAIGNCLQNLLRYDEALYYFGKAQIIMDEIADLRGQGFNYGNIGITYEKMGLITEAVEAKLKSLQIAEQLADSSKIASSLGSIAISQTNLREYHKAIENYTKAIEIYERIGRSNNVVHTLANLGVAYKSLNENQKSIESFKRGLALSKEINYPYGRAIVLMNFGETLLDINQPDSAIYYLNESNKIFSQMGALHPLCYNYKVMGKWYKQTGDYKLAIEYFEMTYDLSRKINAPDQHRDAARHLSEVYEITGDYKKALQYQKTFKQYSDSLFNAENVAETTRLESQFQFEKEQAKTDLLHQAELSKKQTILTAVISGLVVVAVLLILLFIEYRRKNAAYKALYRKNLEMMKNQGNRNKNEVLKNGDLYMEIERMMRDDKLFKQKDLSRETFKELLGTNHEYVQQAIKDHAGKTVSEYITSYRIAEAMRLLSDPKYLKGKSLSAIPDEIGLKSQSTFYRIFKDETGMTPLQFQKQSGK